MEDNLRPGGRGQSDGDVFVEDMVASNGRLVGTAEERRRGCS
jgi:hypothetical protein